MENDLIISSIYLKKNTEQFCWFDPFKGETITLNNIDEIISYRNKILMQYQEAKEKYHINENTPTNPPHQDEIQIWKKENEYLYQIRFLDKQKN